MDQKVSTLMNQVIDHLYMTINSTVPPKLPDELANYETLQKLISDLLEIRIIILEFSNGDLSRKVKLKGYIAGALKTLQANLNHLAWQAQVIAAGNFSQRVDFMGDFSVAFNSMVVQLEETIRKYKDRGQELETANRELKRLSLLDGLTQLANRRMFDEVLVREWKRQARNKSVLSVIFCDIDYFKHYNDAYGHQAGDECLKRIAEKLKNSVRRPTDLAARYGGEEFVLVLPDTNGEGAVQVAQRVQKEIQKLKMPHAQSDVDEYVTMSLGVSFTFPKYGYPPDLLVKTADVALYEVKEKGRNDYLLRECKL